MAEAYKLNYFDMINYYQWVMYFDIDLLSKLNNHQLVDEDYFRKVRCLSVNGSDKLISYDYINGTPYYTPLYMANYWGGFTDINYSSPTPRLIEYERLFKCIGFSVVDVHGSVGTAYLTEIRLQIQTNNSHTYTWTWKQKPNPYSDPHTNLWQFFGDVTFSSSTDISTITYSNILINDALTFNIEGNPANIFTIYGPISKIIFTTKINIQQTASDGSHNFYLVDQIISDINAETNYIRQRPGEVIKTYTIETKNTHYSNKTNADMFFYVKYQCWGDDIWYTNPWGYPN